MTTDTVSALITAQSAFTSVRSVYATAEERRSASSQMGTPLKGERSSSDDVVSLSSPFQQAQFDAKKEEKKSENTAIESDSASEKGKAARSMANVEFVYDLKGELSVRYLDTADRLIYQVPSELMVRMREATAKADSALNTQV